MNGLVIIILSFLYTFGGIIVAAGYFPTIKDLIKKKPSANILSYLIWAFCATTASLYAIFVVSDLLLIIVTSLNLIPILTTLILALRLKIKSKK